VIVGAGFSGTLLAINLLRLGAHVVLVERDSSRWRAAWPMARASRSICSTCAPRT
jgi:2-polyprenyl-6-methoxyphenol hydroxylase-like FAD-dependent oxidoreductase